MDLNPLEEGLPEEFYTKLKNATITTYEALLLKSTYDLSHITGLEMKKIDEHLENLAEYMFKNKVVTAKDVKKWKCLSTGCNELDVILQGGIPINGIAELYGGSGVGKTQLCLQLALMAQLSKNLGGLEKKVLYICTEDAFPSRRLKELIDAWNEKYPHLTEAINYEDNIIIEQIDDSEQLKPLICGKLPVLMTKLEIGLVIIDSIAGCFRCENIDADYSKRSQNLITLANNLDELSLKQQALILCVNQVTDIILTGKTEPCMGLSWSNLLTSRFELSKNYENAVRKFKIIFSPNLPQDECNLLITSHGIIGNTSI